MIINIKPVDVLFFRDSKPFSRGNEHFALSLFPPFPQTLYGAIRTKALEYLGCDYEEFKKGNLIFKNEDKVKEIGLEKIKNELGNVSSIGTFILKGPLLFHNNESVYIKLPADVKKVGNRYQKLHPFEWKNVEFDFGINNYPHFKTENPAKDVEGYISLRKFIDFYIFNRTTLSKNDIICPGDIYKYERRVGIGVNPETNTTKEGLLYTMLTVRLKDGWSLFAKIENLSALPNSGFIKFGGANRVCEYSAISDNADPFRFYYGEINNLKNIISQTKTFKLIFLTPALFNKGWLSEKFNNFELRINNLKIKLITAAINKPNIVSGWDLANNKPKPIRKIVPAGSVYYMQLLEGSVDELFEKLNFVNFSDENPNLGFGLTLITGGE
jgi:CRISPR-associated protein Cmr3